MRDRSTGTPGALPASTCGEEREMKKTWRSRLAHGLIFGLGLSLVGSPLPRSSPFAIPALQAQEVVEVTGRDRPIEPEFEEVYRVGVLDGESWEMFAEVAQVAFDAEGNLHVFDGTAGMTRFGGVGLVRSGEMRVLVFDSAGRFVREFGSSGGGPGEFNQPMGFAVLRDGTVVVSDVGHRAYQLFDASGEFQHMVRADDGPDAVSIPAHDIQPDPRGGAVFAGGSAASIVMSAGGAADPPTSRPVLRVGLDGEAARADTVAEGWLPPRTDLEDLATTPAPAELRAVLRGMAMPTVFEPGFLVAILNIGGIVGSLAAAAMGERFGLMIPLFVSIISHAAFMCIATTTSNVLVFTLIVIAEAFVYFFVYAFMFGLIAKFDATGRWAGAASGAGILGVSVGPFLGGVTITNFGYMSVAWLLAIITVVAVAAFAWVGKQMASTVAATA